MLQNDETRIALADGLTWEISGEVTEEWSRKLN